MAPQPTAEVGRLNRSETRVEVTPDLCDPEGLFHLAEATAHFGGQILDSGHVDEAQHGVGIHEVHCDSLVDFPYHHVAGEECADSGIGRDGFVGERRVAGSEDPVGR